MENRYDDYYVEIDTERHPFSLNLREVWQYRDLIVMFTKRDFKLTYKQTVLGPIWIFLNPFLTSIMYTLVFGRIAGIRTDGIPQLVFYLSSNAIWQYFAGCVTKNSKTFTSNANVFGKVYFPRLTVPISNVLSSMIQFGIQMIMVLVFLAYYVVVGQVHPNWWAWPFIPLVLIVLGVMGLGVGIIISSFTTKYRDLSILVSFGVQLWMYATPIVYPLSQIGESSIFTKLIMFNPATAPIEFFRYAVLGAGTVAPGYLVYSAVFAVIVILYGIIVFNRIEKTFMDIV